MQDFDAAGFKSQLVVIKINRIVVASFENACY